MRTYIINLKRSEERRKYVLKEVSRYACMDIELVEAVDGSLLSSEEIDERFDVKRFLYKNRRYPLPAEIGCTLSHRECYRRLLESGEEIALILEDDVSFHRPDFVDNVIESCVEILKEKKTGIIIFSLSEVVFLKGKKIECGYSLNKVWLGYGTQAYLIHRSVAEQLLKSVPSYVADDYQYMNIMGVDIYGVIPVFSTGKSSEGEVQREILLTKENICVYENVPLRYKLRDLLIRIFRKSLIILKIMTVYKYNFFNKENK